MLITALLFQLKKHLQKLINPIMIHGDLNSPSFVFKFKAKHREPPSGNMFAVDVLYWVIGGGIGNLIMSGRGIGLFRRRKIRVKIALCLC